MPKKKSPITVILIILGFLILGFGLFWVYKSFIQETVLPDPPDGKKISTENIYTSSYICDVASGTSSDLCDVIAFIDKCDVSSTKYAVIFRWSGSFDKTPIYVDTNGDNILEWWSWKSSGHITPSGSFITNTPLGHPVYLTSQLRLFIFDSGRHYHRYGSQYAQPSVEIVDSCGANEVCREIQLYTCSYTWKGETFTRTEDYAWSNSTNQIRINEQQQVNFQPRDGNNQPLPQDNFYLEITKWDMSCAIEYTNKCDPQSEADYCLGYTCSSGYVYHSGRTYCRDTQTYRYDVCQKTSYPYNCIDPFTNQYKDCDGQNANNCPIFKTKKSCSGAQVCIPNGGTEGQAGIGYCKCSPTDCSKGDRRVSQLGYDYDLCVDDLEGCYTWEGRPCQTGTTYDSVTKKCIYPASECSASQKRCNGQTVQSCYTDNIKDEAGNVYYIWNNVETCTPPKSCTEIDSFNAICKCDCDLGDIKCISGSTTHYEKCTSNCWEEFKLPDCKKCVSNELITPIGCTCDNPPCPAGETCINNVCESQQCGEDFCTSNDPNYLTGQGCVGQDCVCSTIDPYCTPVGAKKCDPSTTNTFFKCQAISGSCPKWSTSPFTCTSPRICKNDNCICPTTNACSSGKVGETSCKDLYTVQKCYNVNGCFIWKIEEECGEGLICFG